MPKKLPRSYRHLTQADRDRVEALLDADETQREIAKILNVHPSTISRERQRERKDGRYEATVSERKANVARLASKYQGMKVENNPKLKAHIITELGKKRSPDEIAGRMKLDKLPFYASKNAIYKWLYSVWGQPYCSLLCTQRRRKKRQTRKTERVMIPNRVSIHERPLGATHKTHYGHFEGDTVVAPKRVENNKALAMTTERKTKLLLGTKIASLANGEMTRAVRYFKTQVAMASITLDNGIENRGHETWGILAFFADPHSPWQKGLIEQSIGLLRRWYWRKGTDWAKVSEDELQAALSMLNNEYRKSLGYRSAYEVAMAHGIIKKINPVGSCT